MPDSSLNEQLIGYLLNELPQDETSRLDELSVVNDEFSALLEETENDLVDDYVRGELPEKQRARFETYYLSSSERRDKVSLARTILKHADSVNVERQKQKMITDLPFRTRTVQWGAIAAAVLMFLFAGYFLAANIRMQNQIAKMKEEYTGLKERERQLQRDLVRRRSVDAEKEKQLALARERLETLERQLAGHQSAPVEQFAFTLLPQHRDITPTSKLRILSKTELVVFTLKLETDDFSLYEVVLKNPVSDEVLWRSASNKSVNHSVVVKLPTKILKSADYLLEVSGITQSSNPVVVASYPFNVVIH